MNQTSLILLAVASLLCGAGLWLLGKASTKQKQAESNARLDQVMGSNNVKADIKDPLKVDYLPQSVVNLLIASGIETNKRNISILYGIILGPSVLMLISQGVLEAFGVLMLISTTLFIVCLQKQKKRKEILLGQLPAFLDSVTRVSAVGYSLSVSFNSAVDIAEQPLKNALSVAVEMQQAGLELDLSMQRLSNIYQMTEFNLLASVIRLALTYGGKSDILLGRLGQYLRDREHQHKEMMALSSEARSSAFVMMALSPFVVGMILTFNPEYLTSMWYDSSGRSMIYFAAVLQVIGALLMRRMVKSF